MDDDILPEFPKRLWSKGNEPRAWKSITHFSGEKRLMEALEKALNKDEWEEISESELGVFFKFFKMKFGWASRVVHYVLSMQLECHLNHEIWSLIGSVPIRFSLNEFEMLTGLNCEYIDDLEYLDREIVVTEEMTAFWKNCLNLDVDTAPTVEQLANVCSSASQWEREDRIRLGYLAIYAQFIEARKPSTPVRLSLARLVMDVQAFLEYPWGRLAFKNLIREVRSKGTELCKSAYTIEGFVEALQVWVYYALPDFAFQYGDPIPNKPTPPLLAFGGSRGRKHMKRNMCKKDSVVKSMVLKKERREMFPNWDNDNEDPRIENIVSAVCGDFGRPWKWKTIHWEDEGVLPNLQSRKRESSDFTVEKADSMVSEEASRKRLRLSASSYADESGSFVDVIKRHFDKCCKTLSTEMRVGFERCDYNISYLTGKVEGLEQTLAVMKAANEMKDRDDAKGGQDVGGQDVGDQGGGGEQVKSNDEKDDGEQVKSNDQKAGGEQEQPKENQHEKEQVRSKVVVSESVNMGMELDQSVEVVDRKLTEAQELFAKQSKQDARKKAAMAIAREKSDRIRTLAPSQKSPYQGNSTARSIVPTLRPPAYDPFQRVDKQKVKALEEFIRSDPSYRKKAKGTPSEWFYTLRTPTKWLMDTHLDAAISLLRQRFTKHPEWFRSERICFIDTMLHRMWHSKYGEFQDSAPNPDGGGKLLPAGAWQYYSGEEPRYCRSDKTWVLEVDDIYAPMHIKDDHWVALYISLPHRHITIWDSSYRHASDAEITKAVTPIAVILPHLLRECNITEKHKFPLTPFTHERVEKGVPQNIQSGDCGVFAIKYIECHALGLPFTDALRDSNMKLVREKLAAEIFDETNLCGKEKTENWNVLDLYEPR